MSDLFAICAFNAAYARTIDSDALEQWPSFFTTDCHYCITHVENLRDGLPAGIVYADSRAMLEDRVSALREANIFERQRYRHILGMPFIGRGAGAAAPLMQGAAPGHDWPAETANDDGIHAETPFVVVRIMHTGESLLFATGAYHDRFVRRDGHLLLAERVVVCDSTATDTLMALPL